MHSYGNSIVEFNSNMKRKKYSVKYKRNNIAIRIYKVCKRNGKLVIRVALGLEICEIAGLRKGDRVDAYMHKTRRNSFIIKKCDGSSPGHKLYMGHSTGNFLNFEFRYMAQEAYRLGQTVYAEYDFNDEGIIFINIEKLLWSE